MMKMRAVTFGSLMALVALLFLAFGANQANASPFNPTFTATVSSTAPGATADITTNYSFGIAPDPLRAFPSSFSTFTPAGFNIPTNAGCSLAAPASCAYPMGVTTGTANSTTTFGLFNGACAVNIPIFFPGSPASTGLQNASTLTSDSISPGAGFAALIADTNPADGVMDGAEHWNTLLAALGLPGPRERQVATANLFGTTIWLDVVTYDPGVLAPAGLGYITLTIVENFSPALPPSPSIITDACGLKATSKESGLAGNGAIHRSNPTAPGTAVFFFSSVSSRDADNDGFVNPLDTCPFTPNVGSPEIPGQPQNGDDSEAPPGDGIDSACDNNPSVNDGADADGDGFLNRGDNCPQVANPTQSDVLELGPTYTTPGVNAVGAALADPAWWVRVGPQPVDGGPRNDSIGDACDINPTVADGHYHAGLNLSAQCIGSSSPFVDSDGDGWCDGTEVVLGSNPANPASTPENLAVPGTCSDGKDNNLNGLTDLADPGCQLPNHDIQFRSPNGVTANAKDMCGGSNGGGDSESGNVVSYIAHLRKAVSGGAAEPAQIGIMVSDVFGTGGSGPAVTSVSGASVTASGPINIDGNKDVEWLTKGLVTIAPTGITNVHFTVTFPPCHAGPDVSPVDYSVTVDLCHSNDIAPLGLFGAGACGAAADGGQDRVNTTNDAPITILVNDVSK